MSEQDVYDELAALYYATVKSPAWEDKIRTECERTRKAEPSAPPTLHLINAVAAAYGEAMLATVATWLAKPGGVHEANEA